MNLGETYMSLPNDLSGSASKNRFRLELLWGISKMFDIYDKDDFIYYIFKCVSRKHKGIVANI